MPCASSARSLKHSEGHFRLNTAAPLQMAQVVYSNVSGNVGTEGTLFEGLKIWFARRVPQRQRFVQLVQVSDESMLRP